MQLIDLLEKVPLLEVKGSLKISCTGLTFDSRRIEAGMVFVAVPGTQVDGHQFVSQALRKGAAAVVLQKEVPEQEEGHSAVFVRTENSARALGLMAANWYDHPSRKLKLVGVTGTNGKTTTVTLLHQLFQGMGYRCGLLSTVENRIGQEKVEATHTTPDPISLNRLLARMVDAGCEYAFMEVSSHAVAQERIAGLRFRGAVFTNLTHDHLDYHGSFRAYLEAKKKFFDELDEEAFALVNQDDRNGRVMVQNTAARIFSYGLRTMADFKARLLENSIEGLLLEMDKQQVHSRLVGEFNAYNLLCVYGVGRLLGFASEELLSQLSLIGGAEGRFEMIRDPARGRFGVVDYAHTPDALEKVVDTLLKVKMKTDRLVVVVGCGGDRDKEKRPQMASIATRADLAILTSDNPRNEDPDAILADMENGIPPEATARVMVNADRKQAIRMAVQWARRGDIILVAGKGHEKYQEIRGERIPFDDREVLWNAFSESREYTDREAL